MSPTNTETAPPTDETVNIALWPHQIEAVYNCDQYRWLNEIGGRGSGKTFKDRVRIVRWAEMCTELPFGIFGATEEMLQSALTPIRETIEEMGIDHVYGTRVPPEWQAQWDYEGIPYPAQRLRSTKFWIWENGAHFFTGSIVNNAVTRAKGIDFNCILVVEGTEPGVDLKAIMTLYGGLRCGSATRGSDGVWRCRVPGHLHQLVFEGNVPLNDPSHWIYKKNERMLAQEEARKVQGLPPFYRLLTSSTKDNPATGADYDDGLRAMFDETTYIEQTSGELKRNVARLSYHAFSDQNILDTLVYDPRRPLHIWFDWNATPAAVGWGHDLQAHEVPEHERAKGRKYFGIIGELFSGEDPLHTDQVADALLVDGSAKSDGPCVHCNHEMKVHMVTGSGWLCKPCQWTVPGVKPDQYCSGVVKASPLNPTTQAKYIHAPDNWRGLMRHRGMVHVYGDVNDGRGNAASVAGGSIQILRDVLGDALGDRVAFHFPPVNPRVKLRALAVNRGFQDADRKRSVFIHSRCEAHITDFREVIPDPKTGEPLKVSKSPSQRKQGNDYWLRTDISDAWGYHWSLRYPFIRPGSSGMPLGMDEEDYGPFATFAEP